jgi:tetratricopeptide (TPR) repeat protein
LSNRDPQVLFETSARPREVPGHRSFLRRARQEHEQNREASSQLSLAAFLVASLVDRMLRVSKDPSDIDGFRWQVRSTRHFVRELPENHAERAHLVALIDAMDGEPPLDLSGVRMSLMAYGYFLNQASRLEDALDILELAGRCHREGLPVEEYASFAMFVGRVLRRLASFPAATVSYQEAVDAARAAGDEHTELFSILGLANLFRSTGDLRRSQGLVEEVLQRTEAFLASIDDAARWRTLANLGASLASLGEYDAARCALEVVASRSTVFGSRTNAVIELLGVASAVKDELGFRRYLREAESRLDAMPPSMAIDYHYQAGVGMARFGSLRRSRDYLTRALALAEEHRLNTWYFRIERVLRALAACPDAEMKVPPTPRGVDASPLGEIAQGLREFATANM